MCDGDRPREISDINNREPRTPGRDVSDGTRRIEKIGGQLDIKRRSAGWQRGDDTAGSGSIVNRIEAAVKLGEVILAVAIGVELVRIRAYRELHIVRQTVAIGIGENCRGESATVNVGGNPGRIGELNAPRNEPADGIIRGSVYAGVSRQKELPVASVIAARSQVGQGIVVTEHIVHDDIIIPQVDADNVLACGIQVHAGRHHGNAQYGGAGIVAHDFKNAGPQARFACEEAHADLGGFAGLERNGGRQRRRHPFAETLTFGDADFRDHQRGRAIIRKHRIEACAARASETSRLADNTGAPIIVEGDKAVEV